MLKWVTISSLIKFVFNCRIALVWKRKVKYYIKKSTAENLTELSRYPSQRWNRTFQKLTCTSTSVRGNLIPVIGSLDKHGANFTDSTNIIDRRQKFLIVGFIYLMGPSYHFMGPSQ